MYTRGGGTSFEGCLNEDKKMRFFKNPVLFSCYKYSIELENLHESFTATPAWFHNIAKTIKNGGKITINLKLFF